MWLAREKSGCLIVFNRNDKPIKNEDSGTWGYFRMNEGDYLYIDKELFSDLSWNDDPIEIEITSIKELKNLYHELLEFKTSKINNLSGVYKSIQLEEVTEFINAIEVKIYSKYKMIGNPFCKQNIRGISIANSANQPSDNSLREYIVNDNVVVTIYVRRNEFNTADIIISDLGDIYNNF